MDQEERDAEETGIDAASISALVISLATSAAVHFGDLPDAESGERQAPNLPAAKHMIDLLETVEQKTRGNLTEDEAGLLRQVLYELRMRFVQAAGAEKKIIIP